jgi:hypothetical protein
MLCELYYFSSIYLSNQAIYYQQFRESIIEIFILFIIYKHIPKRNSYPAKFFYVNIFYFFVSIF